MYTCVWDVKDVEWAALLRESNPRVLYATCTEIGKKVWLFARLQPGRARKRINAT